ncbi:nucleoside/nucleotide kinase family protein [Aeromicrobium sp. S22]|uniref:nucleoside/nucleotide kinase family protein n=1 Tax=Aeromicrobium sp. S22 TaxID=2662029 RepID=UPI0013C0B051|nr:nucleoside/nucleotide kinase family protein [Aeromicrobium sp. S22]MRK02491.1 nucleoside/nucleotide kinase family protein [Aeromicrobium sp. S22]
MHGLDELVERAAALVTDDVRTIVGVCGAPGSGKTTVATRLVSRLAADGVPAARVPMDGFHLSDDVLRARGLLDVKGAPQTFDAYGFLALLARLRTETDHPVYAPGFERTLEQPIAASIEVAPDVRVVVTEGNYLLDADPPWPLVREALDEVWFVDLADDRRRARLVDRHVTFGKSRDEAQAWVDRVDEPNARRVIARRDTADLVIDGR